MKPILFALALAAPIFLESVARPAELRVVHVRLVVADPLAHVSDLQRLARTLESAPGVKDVALDASRARVDVTVEEDADSSALVTVAEHDGFHVQETRGLAVR